MYFSEMTRISVQKISDKTPSTLSGVTGIGSLPATVSRSA